ncbi:TetR/AcrR family transcriptional regulator [Cellulomonas pakistanensis]|uniref:TetR family transcriptional regulator n=1 Tax=Cellulomonas pakistanensis TaxID=992287 RepID=A0A919P6D0_9CELL|nr:TetR/AcrR family transcriptional regulator [Cellulomonas pakistanensis]GIG34926.1 TetR family transcriptional regulator [Cellulomonas pakistanensis]
MPDPESAPASSRRRADAERNIAALLEAAAAEFVRAGVDVPVRDVATRAGVGVGTIYRHFPTRADLVIAVYRHQIDSLAQRGPELLRTASSPSAALTTWVDEFVDFLVTKHGLAGALRSTDPSFDALHTSFVSRLVPVCGELLAAGRGTGELTDALGAYELMRSVGNLCIGAETDERYDARAAVAVLLAGLRSGDH